jgi:UDP-N-acetylmuramoyl-tripeptide--D-alanyl-D-alanine ligase
MMIASLARGSGLPVWIATAAAAVAVVLSGGRWLRVAQREHYLPDSASRFALRWWFSEPLNAVLLLLAAAGIVAAAWWPLAALVTAVAVAVGPLHLTLRGRTSRLAPTRRLRTLAVVWLVLEAVVIAVGVVLGAAAPVAATAALGVPVLVDVACALTVPVERRLGQRFIDTATERLRRISPVVVGITGSYGKTSTKNHVAHLVTGTRTVVPTPASFNNRAGLARAINEHLADGTEVFVAEMGTYGAGEIADLCAWCPPQIAVITAIGPVHLERFGSEDRIVRAKSEITRGAAVVVLNVDDPRLAALGEQLAAGSGVLGAVPAVVRCSAADEFADVCVRPAPEEGPDRYRVSIGGRLAAAGVPLGSGVQPGNVACALAVALQLGVPEPAALERIGTIPAVPNRLTSATAPSGVVVIDDTFNSNPAGTRAALAALGAVPATGRRAVVTPGMVELGPAQAVENRSFARAAAEVATDLVVVGLTNRRALVQGAAPLRPVTVRTREEAVEWVRRELGPSDAVLYENDLPDHYP